MTPMSRELWAEIRPLLEAGLELEGEARAAWLAELRARSPALADEVSALLGKPTEELDRLFTPASRVDLFGQSLAGQIVGGVLLNPGALLLRGAR